MSGEDLQKRTRIFALRIIRFVEGLPATKTSRILGDQLIRAGTSVGANYRACCRARSRADFIARLKIVEEECDEALYWLELLVENGCMASSDATGLLAEGFELLSIIVTSIKTARSNR
jgi:four helix bundle protein